MKVLRYLFFDLSYGGALWTDQVKSDPAQEGVDLTSKRKPFISRA